MSARLTKCNVFGGVSPIIRTNVIACILSCIIVSVSWAPALLPRVITTVGDICQVHAKSRGTTGRGMDPQNKGKLPTYLLTTARLCYNSDIAYVTNLYCCQSFHSRVV